MGGKFHLKLNIGERPIANKYREGKMKRTLKRELKVLEIVKREAIETSDCRRFSYGASFGCFSCSFWCSEVYLLVMRVSISLVAWVESL